jgi:hypothetical protein
MFVVLDLACLSWRPRGSTPGRAELQPREAHRVGRFARSAALWPRHVCSLSHRLCAFYTRLTAKFNALSFFSAVL